jgi:hypothetical protein
MAIYVFVSILRPDILAFTEDEIGSNLPVIYAPWERTSSGSALYVGKDHDRVAAAVRQDGYFLVSGGESDLDTNS